MFDKQVWGPFKSSDELNAPYKAILEESKALNKNNDIYSEDYFNYHYHEIKVQEELYIEDMITAQYDKWDALEQA